MIQKWIRSTQLSRCTKLWIDAAVTGHFVINLYRYKKHDADSSGYIDRSEFESLYNELKHLGYQIGTIQNAYSVVDRNNDGDISMREFVMWLTKASMAQNLGRQKSQDLPSNQSKTSLVKAAQKVKVGVLLSTKTSRRSELKKENVRRRFEMRFFHILPDNLFD